MGEGDEAPMATNMCDADQIVCVEIRLIEHDKFKHVCEKFTWKG